jgi:hypothetical protein
VSGANVALYVIADLAIPAHGQRQWSRGRSLAADDNQQQTTILRRLHDSFTQLGGVPHENVTDTMSGVVDGWECNQPILNIRFVDFAAYYRFAVHVSPVATRNTRARSSDRFGTSTRTSAMGGRFAAVRRFAKARVVA